MAMSRSLGGTSLTTLPPMEMVPPVTSSRPATIRSAVDLPQPEGPTSTMNSPSRMSRSSPSMTRTSPNRLVTPLSTTPAISRLRRAVSGARLVARILRSGPGSPDRASWGWADVADPTVDTGHLRAG